MPYLFEAEEHALLRATVKRFAQTHIAPNAHKWDEANEFPRELYATAATAGLFGMPYSEEDGGGGGDFTHALVADDELIISGHSVSVCVGLGSHNTALPPIMRLGTAEQKKRFVLPVLNGEKISALGITEPSGGSDVASIRTKAVRDGDDHYIVNGSKTFITSGSRADVVTTAVRTGGEGGAGISLLVIERETPGFTVGKRFAKTGLWASDTAELSFDNCRVPVANLIGEENDGFAAIMLNFATERLSLANQCVAIASLAYQEAVKYARERTAFGKTLMGHQVTRHKLADMASKITAARALVCECAVRILQEEEVLGFAAMTKNIATDACLSVVDDAVQIHGGNGYMREFLVERLYRDARMYPIVGGTREIMNEIISKTEGYETART